MACISLYSGLRLGEILSLIRGDLKMEDWAIHVRDAKGGTRIAHMNETVKAIFDDMLPGSPSSLLFPSRNGELLDETQLGKTFTRAVSAVGLNKGITDRRHKAVFHTLRHTFASWLAIDGVPLYTISKLMGHSNIEMTMRYAHLCPDAKSGAVKLLDKRSTQMNHCQMDHAS